MPEDFPVEAENEAGNKKTSSDEKSDFLGIGITSTGVSKVDLNFFSAFEIPILG